MTQNSEFADRIARIEARNGSTPSTGVSDEASTPTGGALPPKRSSALAMGFVTLVGLALIGAGVVAMMHSMLGPDWATKLATGIDAEMTIVDVMVADSMDQEDVDAFRNDASITRQIEEQGLEDTMMVRMVLGN